MDRKDMDAIDENYTTMKPREELTLRLEKKKGGLYARGTSELLTVECIGTIEENGNVAPLLELIESLKEGEWVAIKVCRLPPQTKVRGFRRVA